MYSKYIQLYCNTINIKSVFFSIFLTCLFITAIYIYMYIFLYIYNVQQFYLTAPPDSQCFQRFLASLPCLLVQTNHLTSCTWANTLQCTVEAIFQNVWFSNCHSHKLKLLITGKQQQHLIREADITVGPFSFKVFADTIHTEIFHNTFRSPLLKMYISMPKMCTMEMPANGNNLHLLA